MIGAVTLSRARLNVSKLSTRRIGISRETQMKEFDQAGSELGSTLFENNRRLHPDRKPFENQGQKRHGKHQNQEF